MGESWIHAECTTTFTPVGAMPVSFHIDKDQHLVVSVWSGVVTMEEAREHNAALRADPDFDPSMRQLSDARDAESTVSVDDLRLLARETPFGKLSRRAVVGSSDLVFGVSAEHTKQGSGALHTRQQREVGDAEDREPMWDPYRSSR